MARNTLRALVKNPQHILIVGASSDLAQAVTPMLSGRMITPISRTTLDSGEYEGADWSAILEEASRNSPIDAVLHIPGYGAFGQATSLPEADARRAMEVNFWLLTKVALAANAHWVSTNRPGTFHAVLSLAALRAIPKEAWYCAGKAASARWLETMDLENRKEKRRFFFFCPGKFRSKFRREAGLRETDGGTPIESVARVIAGSVIRGRPGGVIGWREKTIVLADRLWPGLYDNLVLRHRS